MINYSNYLSSKVKTIKPSGIRKFFDILEEMGDVVSLTIGQPDFATPWNIREAGIDSLNKGRTHYTSNRGLTELREELAKYLENRFSLKYDPKDEIIITVGGSEAIDAALRALVDDGDEVLIVSPAYVSYSPLVSLAGGVPVEICVKEENSFKLTPGELRGALTPKTKLLILPYPGNPTGAIMDKSDLDALVPVIKEAGLMVITDEIYAELTYGERHVSVASYPGMRERCVLVSSFSKTYAMTGWRIGYVCAPAPVTEQIFKIHQFAEMCAPTMSQYAAITALRDGAEDVEYMVGQYDMRRRLILDGLAGIGLGCFEPRGAFYAFPSIKKFGLSSEEFCERLLYEYKVGIVPGTAFGGSGEGYARISYAYSPQHITKALEKIGEFVKKLEAEGKLR